MSTYRAHTGPSADLDEPVRDHLDAVARRAAEFAEAFDAQEQAYVAGLLHDLGKYGDLFQARLDGRARGVDHASAGATEVLRRYQLAGVGAALAVQGHHGGLQVAAKDTLCRLSPARLGEQSPEGLTRSEPDLDVLLSRFAEDGFTLPESLGDDALPVLGAPSAAAMLDVRMLYSALVDADFIETENYFRSTGQQKKPVRPEALPLEPTRALETLLAHIDLLARTNAAADRVLSLRADLLHACLQGAEMPPGLFTLTAPTGSGKTLSMLAFALKHAVEHDLRRIVMVIPYLSIIEQTVGVYRTALAAAWKPDELHRYILEHHSLAGTRGAGGDDAGDGRDERAASLRLLTENWDAPIVVTTSVQFLESLFANRPGACRKLHRLARSVILFDEVQTLGARLAVPTLATLSRLAERHGASVLFSTATQPAFSHLDETVKRFAAAGWQPREVVPADLNLFKRAERTRVLWPARDDAPADWPELADGLLAHEQILCIVNLKRHAWALLDALGEHPHLFHLSTNMCPAHRQKVLDEVRLRLDEGVPCRLVSTQCVEAGVDVDFPVVWRAWGPLEAIAQAAGRCNRNGHAERGDVLVFTPPTDDGKSPYPDPAYAQAAQVAQALLNELGPDGLDIGAADAFERYYRRIYSLQDPARYDCLRTTDDLIQAICERHFPNVSQKYRVIDQDAVNVVVAFDPDVFESLAYRARQDGITRDWVQAARAHTIGIFRAREHDPIYTHLEPVPLPGAQEFANDWFLYITPEHYTRWGLRPPQADSVLLA